MIVSIQGILEDLQPLQAVIQVDGIGYEVHIPLSTAEKLPKLGERVKLYTHVVYREDAQTLYGFLTTDERAFFKLITEKVSGVGPRTALALLSKHALATLIDAIQNHHIALLKECPGIGAKTAERIALELKDKVGALACMSLSALTHSSPSDVVQDAIAALVALGYKPAEAAKGAQKAFDQMSKTDSSVSIEMIIKKVLEK